MSIVDRIGEWALDAKPGDQAHVIDEDGQVQYTVTIGERMPAVYHPDVHIVIPHEHVWIGESRLCDPTITLTCPCGATMTEERALSDTDDDTDGGSVADVDTIR